MLLELSVDAVLGEVLCVSFLSFSGDSTVFGKLSVNVLVSRDLLEFKLISISVGGLERKANNSCLRSLMEVENSSLSSVMDVCTVFSEVWIAFATVLFS